MMVMMVIAAALVGVVGALSSRKPLSSRKMRRPPPSLLVVSREGDAAAVAGGELLLERIAAVAARCVPDSYLDPKIGTWLDNPVGGAAERDGSWVDAERKAELAALLAACDVAGDAAETARRLARETVVYMVAEEERFEVKVIALAAGGDAARSTEPAGSVSLSKVLVGAAATVPLRRVPRSMRSGGSTWEPRASSRRMRRPACGIWTYLGGPPREASAEGARDALVLEVVLRPPREERILLDGVDGGPPVRVTDLSWADLKVFVERGSSSSSSSSTNVLESATATAPPPRWFGHGVVGGLDSVIGELERRLLASRQLDASELEALGVAHARGALLYGPPGCGKTLVARTLAAAMGAEEDRVFVINGPELLDKFVGVAEERVRALFDRSKAEWARYVIKRARFEKKDEDINNDDPSGLAERRLIPGSSAPPPLNVLIFDEIDAVTRTRGSLSGDTTGVRDSVTAQLLASLDGIDDAGNLVVIATTNRPELIDPALLRPGRLEVKIRVPVPDAKGRRAILAIHTDTLRRRGRLAPDALVRLDDPTLYDQDTDGFSGADGSLVRFTSAKELAGLTRAMVSSSIARSLGDPGSSSSPGMIISVRREDIDRAVLDIQTDRLAAANNMPCGLNHSHETWSNVLFENRPAWPELARLEALWLGRHGDGERCADVTAARTFLEHLAYEDRAIALPIDRAALDDLAHHCFHYLARRQTPAASL